MRSHKPITKTAAWKHEHEFVNTMTRWDNYPLQTIKWRMVSANHDGEKRKGVMDIAGVCVTTVGAWNPTLVSISILPYHASVPNRITLLLQGHFPLIIIWISADCKHDQIKSTLLFQASLPEKQVLESTKLMPSTSFITQLCIMAHSSPPLSAFRISFLS